MFHNSSQKIRYTNPPQGNVVVPPTRSCSLSQKASACSLVTLCSGHSRPLRNRGLSPLHASTTTNPLPRKPTDFPPRTAPSMLYLLTPSGGIYTNISDSGLRLQVFFPSCWNGKDLDSADHKSHMAYPDGVDSGKCPSTHPVRFISLFYEVMFSVNDFRDMWYDNKQPFLLANGDPTGFGKISIRLDSLRNTF